MMQIKLKTQRLHVRHMKLCWLLTIALMLCAGVSQSASTRVTLNLFEPQSLGVIEQAYQGKAFILVLWSIDCPPCIEELKLLARMQNSGLAGRVVLVATDGEDYRDVVEDLLAQEDLSRYEHWRFHNTLPERLRYSIDPDWYGELPRAYFYDAQGQRVSHSGLLNENLLQEWLATFIRSSQYAPQ